MTWEPAGCGPGGSNPLSSVVDGRERRGGATPLRWGPFSFPEGEGLGDVDVFRQEALCGVSESLE